MKGSASGCETMARACCSSTITPSMRRALPGLFSAHGGGRSRASHIQHGRLAGPRRAGRNPRLAEGSRSEFPRGPDGASWPSGMMPRRRMILPHSPLAREQAAAYCEMARRFLRRISARLGGGHPRGCSTLDKVHASADYHGGTTVAKTFALAMTRPPSCILRTFSADHLCCAPRA